MTGRQGELAGMPRRLYPCTPTRLTTWLDCPRRYRFTYLDRPSPPKGPPWAHNSVGAAVHAALADWFSLPFAQRTPGRGGELVRRRWLHDGFRDEAQSAASRHLAVGWVQDYLAGVDPAHEPAGVERTVSTLTDALVVTGRVDRLDRRPDGGGALVVVDYKTGRRPPQPGEARVSLALALYAVAAARTLREPCTRVELHHLPSLTVVADEHTPAGLRRKVSEAESIATDARRADEWYRADPGERDGRTPDEVFPATPSPMCSWCDFRRHCRDGRAAAPDLAPWSAAPAP